ncbi:MAG: hypothetical protein Q9227_001471 [Pyrenula ochraceoflavens]
MPLRKGSKKAGLKPRSIGKRAIQPSGKLVGFLILYSTDVTIVLIAPSRDHDFNIRTRSSAHSPLLSEEFDPELILRKTRKPQSVKQNQNRPEHLSQSQLTRLKRSVETLPLDQRQQTTDEVADERYGEVIPSDSESIDTLQAFYSEVGYLPPLDEEASTVIRQILARSNMADEYTRIGPENSLFLDGLQYRNVSD